MRMPAGGQPGLQAGVGRRGGGFGVAVVHHRQRPELQAARFAPGDAVGMAVPDFTIDPPAFERCRAMRGQGHPQVAGVGMRGRGVVAEAEHRQQPGVVEQGIERRIPILDAQGFGGGGGWRANAWGRG
jgi:hypothetical protein